MNEGIKYRIPDDIAMLAESLLAEAILDIHMAMPEINRVGVIDILMRELRHKRKATSEK